MVFRESRRKYYAQFIAKTIPPQEETPAMQCGTLTHCAILQGHKLGEEMAVIPNELLSADGGIRSKEAKAWKEAAEADGKIVVKDHELASTLAPIIGMRDAILNSHAGHWFSRPDAIAEKSIKWQDAETGLMLRALPDFRLDLGNEWLATDIKTCADMGKFKWAVKDGYWMQHVHYEDGLRSLDDKPVTFTFLAVEKTPPYLVRCFQMTDRMIQEARDEWRKTLRDLAECYASGDWSDPGEDEVQYVDERIW